MKKHKTYRLSEEALRLLEQIAVFKGLTRTATIETLIREEWRRIDTKAGKGEGVE